MQTQIVVTNTANDYLTLFLISARAAASSFDLSSNFGEDRNAVGDGYMARVQASKAPIFEDVT